MEEDDAISDEHKDVSTVVKNRKLKSKHQTTSESSDLESDGGKLSEESSEPSEEVLEEERDGENDSGESDPVEQDVKVCDICGDAGREDLLAMCCRCPDGAEHSYCMKVGSLKLPVGDWFCEECKLEEENKNRNTSRQKFSTETGAQKGQSSDPAVVKVSGKRRAEELESSSSFKKQALETVTGVNKDVDRGKVKTSNQFSSDSQFSNESAEGSRSPATRPRSQSLKGAFFKSNSFSFPNARAKTKLVDEIVLQRQKSTKERPSHETREMGKSMSFRSANLGRFGPNTSKVKMLSPNTSHAPDLKSSKNKKDRTFERTNSVKLSASSSAALHPKNDKVPGSRGENAPVTSGSNSEVKPLKGESTMISGLRSNSRSANLSAEVPASLVNKQLPSSPTKVGSSCGGIISSSEQKSNSLKEKEDNASKLAVSRESTSNGEGMKETTTTSQLGPGSLAMRNSKEVKNRDNKLKDAIEAALLKKPGIYRKNRGSDQADELSVSTTSNEVAAVDRLPQSRNAGSLSLAEVSADSHGPISRNSNVDHSKQSNGNNSKQSMILPTDAKHLSTALSNFDDAALSSHPKNQAIPDQECVWQGSFEINRSGKAAEFWDGLQAHLSMCASSRVSETVNNLPHRILLNGVSRISAWPAQFENRGVKEDNIAIYFFAKDLESYEKSYQVLLDEMIRGDLALIGSINGVELLIFPSNQLPERSNRWNMLFFLWGVFRGKKKNSLHQVPNYPERNCIPQVISTDKRSSAPDLDKDKNVDSVSKGNLKLDNASQEKITNNISSPPDAVNVVPAVADKSASGPNKGDNQDIVKFSRNLETDPKKRSFIDLSEDDEVPTTNQINTSHDASSRMAEGGSISKKQKTDVYGQDRNLENVSNTSEPKENGERFFFPVAGSSGRPRKLALDLNQDITCLADDTDGIIMTRKDEEEDNAASSLSLSLAFLPPDKG
uniref:serine-rich adhesin for platelets-like n=1 Tax=Erigeron canadensis TaxID=72917 RepID=UPI001CB8EBDA|nr:serine-rich adhesin for platelets-like [Erigeron canadensis]